ncbi:peptidase M23B [Desulfosudis oleivorans Hxd3]|uniref:Peptidase M23B n=1 Tax=Desulfosudis oleivorans (strain DSM 6200 / JCM 39069 / Hxd3) TaxID=96561 RepID=A8ZU10_DESOH|nr:peptidase M23B [Desulfosudis oleivorans Hxd3]
MRSKSDGKSRAWPIILMLMLAAGAVALLILFFPRLEGKAPVVAFSDFNPAIGTSSSFTVSVSDDKSGLRHVWMALLVDGREVVLADESYTAPVSEKDFNLTIEPGAMDLPDGPALLRISVTDNAARNWLKGNLTYLEQAVTIDTRKPDVSVISRQHYVNQGGAGLVVYRVAEPGTTHGVLVGDNFFPGHQGVFSDKTLCLALFAVDHRQGKDTPLLVSATDAAGNTAKTGFYYLIKPKTFPKDVLTISDTFLNLKMPEFDLPEEPASLLDKFVTINSAERKRNVEKIVSLCRTSDSALHWKGDFIRLPNAAPRAGFADQREYVYNGKTVSHSVHMGIDLASLANAEVPAANAGRVVFADWIGIFGKTVVIDHGCGLFSMYSHLSTMDVTPGKMVERGTPIGRTGMTGMAAGDHLHFGMMVHGTFVNPLEWWDAAWITNNITSKIEAVADLPRL